MIWWYVQIYYICAQSPFCRQLLKDLNSKATEKVPPKKKGTGPKNTGKGNKDKKNKKGDQEATRKHRKPNRSKVPPADGKADSGEAPADSGVKATKKRRKSWASTWSDLINWFDSSVRLVFKTSKNRYSWTCVKEFLITCMQFNYMQYIYIILLFLFSMDHWDMQYVQICGWFSGEVKYDRPKHVT